MATDKRRMIVAVFGDTAQPKTTRIRNSIRFASITTSVGIEAGIAIIAEDRLLIGRTIVIIICSIIDGNSKIVADRRKTGIRRPLRIAETKTANAVVLISNSEAMS